MGNDIIKMNDANTAKARHYPIFLIHLSIEAIPDSDLKRALVQKGKKLGFLLIVLYQSITRLTNETKMWSPLLVLHMNKDKAKSDFTIDV